MGVGVSDVKAKISSTQWFCTGEERLEETQSHVTCFDQMTEYTVVSPTKTGRRLIRWLYRQAWHPALSPHRNPGPTTSQLHGHSVPQFPYLQNQYANNNTCSVGFFGDDSAGSYG